MSTPEEIRLAAKQYSFEFDEHCATGDELRRLSALNAELVAALQELGGLEADGMHPRPDCQGRRRRSMTAHQARAIYAQAYAETLCRETSIRLAAAWAEWPVASVREVIS